MRPRRLCAAAAIAAAALALPWLALSLALALSPVDRGCFDSGYKPSTRLFDRTGSLLREVANDRGERANFVALSKLPPLLVDAVLSAEDSAFRSHGGIDLFAVARAFLSNRGAGRTVSGASTITMQLARIAYGEPRSLAGKLSQAFDSLRLEAAFTKDEILERYLNRAPFGPGSIGVGAASRRCFDKDPADLDAAEAALLAGMIQAPGYLDLAKNPEAALRRRNWVLARMHETGRLGPGPYERALAEPLPLPRAAPAILAGHFTDYALSLGPPPGDLVTTLDVRLQESVQAIVANHVRRHAASGLTNAAVVVIDNASGEILAMVGSKDWTDAESGNVNGALALRQPGSALKPFAYALAFERGFSPASMLADIETEYVSNDRSLYIPRNYSRSFRGPVLAKEALASSLNVPAIRLVREVGVGDFLALLRELGFASLDQGADYYGLGLVLGNGEVSPLQIAAAYSALARGGLYVEPSPFPRAVAGRARRVIAEDSAWLVTSILSDETMRIQAFGADSPLQVGFPMAIKTGTSSNWRDSWTVGYTSEFTIAAWSGDFESTPMNQVSGSSGAGPLFNAVARLMGARLGRSPSLPDPPPSVRRIVVCAESGASPTEHCPRKMIVAVADTKPRPACTSHLLVRVDTRTGERATASTPPACIATRVAYELPPEFGPWLKESGKFSLPPLGVSRLVAGDLVVTSPRQGDVYIIEPGYDRARQTIELSASSRNRVGELDWYVDGILVAKAAWPYETSWRLSAGHHAVVARVGGVASEAVPFEVR